MNAKYELETLWGQRLAGVALQKTDLFRPVTDQDVKYLLNRYPFLHLANAAPLKQNNTTAKIIPAQSGWKIHDYGETIISSPGEFLYGGGDYEKLLQQLLTEDDDGGTAVLPGKGTIIKQMVDTAFEMVYLAVQKEWPAINIVEGTQLMQWATWYEAEQQEKNIFGFKAEDEDEARTRRMRKLLTTINETIQPKM